MAYNNNYNKQKRTKPVEKILPMVMTGVTGRDNKEYNVDTCINILSELQSAKVWDKLSIFATMSNTICNNDSTARGFKNVARIQEYDYSEGTMKVVFLGKNTEYAELVNDMVIIPRVRTDFDSTNVNTIMGFEIVNPMDA